MAPSTNSINQQLNTSLSIRGKSLELDTPVVMGILNATPDSFSDGGRYNAADDAVRRIEEMIKEGAAIIDIGGESTRPGAEPVSEEEELERVIPVLERVVPHFPDHFFSVDTRKYEVARQALERGVHIVNDVSGLQKEPRLAGLCAEFNAGYILMHSQGEPQDMQKDPRYEHVLEDVRAFFSQQLSTAREAGLEEIVIDPGIGFGKTLQHNLALLSGIGSFVELGCPIMVGASRKSMFDEILGGRVPEERVSATVAAHYEAMTRGARILRVHDVQQAYDSVQVFNAIHRIES